MRRVVISLLTGLIIQASVSLPAQESVISETLVLPLSTELTNNEMARVLTAGGRPEECLAPIQVTRIDGENRVVPAQGFLIEPGTHSINGKAFIDLTDCPLIDANPVMNSAVDLEVEFEPGGTYHIGFYHAPANTQEWKLVVWHVEESL